MLQCVYEGMENYGSGYSNWAILLHKILKGDLLVTYLDSVNQDEHHEQLRKLHDRTLFKLDENHQVANSFEICHNQSCLLPIEGYENIYNRVLAV
jgi:macrodomain Ter protein organizer (MatP/YcbG family)